MEAKTFARFGGGRGGTWLTSEEGPGSRRGDDTGESGYPVRADARSAALGYLCSNNSVVNRWWIHRRPIGGTPWISQCDILPPPPPHSRARCSTPSSAKKPSGALCGFTTYSSMITATSAAVGTATSAPSTPASAPPIL